MPNYDYRCASCEYVWEEHRSVAERDTPTTLDCPKCGEQGVERFLSSPPLFGDPYRLGVTRVPDSFKDVLKNIKSKHRHSTINTQ